MNMKQKISLSLAGVMTASALLAGCGSQIDQDAIVATLKAGDTTIEISLGQANFMAQYQAVSYDSGYMNYFGEDMWSSDLFGSGKTMTEDVKEDVLEGILTAKLLELHMADYDVTITDEEMDAMKSAAKQFMADNSKKAINKMGAKEEYVVELLHQSRITTKMSEAIKAEADQNVSDDEAAQRTFSYIKVSATGYTDEESNTVEYSAEEKTQLETDMKAVAEAAKEDFEAAAEENEYEVETRSYGTDEASLDEKVIAAADALKEGEVSDLITADDDNYYILRLDSEFDEEKTEAKKESIISQRETDLYNEVLEGYKADVEWTIKEKVWEPVNFEELYTIKAADTEEMTATE